MKNLAFIFTFLTINMFMPLAYAEVELDLDEDKIVRESAGEQENIQSIFDENEKVSDEMERTLEQYHIETAKQNRGGEDSRLLDCNEEKFMNIVKDAIIKYQDANPQTTSIGKRKHKLLIREVESFTEISTDNITSKYSNLLAGEVIKLKINQKIEAEDMRVCKAGNAPEGGYIYVLMYKEKNYITVKILNVAYVGNIEALSFKY